MFHLEEHLITIFTPVTDIIDLVAILFILWGFIKSMYDFFVLRIKNKTLSSTDIKSIRCYLGTYLLLGLEIMIVADIIKTVINQTTEDLIFLGGIVLIRTVLSYFLNKEIEEMKSGL
ncbi:MAG: hypothetical protein DHS20C13_16880 [Thermodesulfobacteriota bacterium]|nr:MAG: hypothetical protein DHS20C13_16880 [Thermodesulfobacteriota bacterium]